jgi:glucose/arabinose dehydrogenase
MVGLLQQVHHAAAAHREPFPVAGQAGGLLHHPGHGRAIADPEFGARRACAEFTPPARELEAHTAALGMRFYDGTQFPDTWRGRIFIAEHGSWNRLPPFGYRVTTARLEGNRVTAHEVFAEGWLGSLTAWGRPVDVQVMPDGALLVSDDKAGVIYRISHGGR